MKRNNINIGPYKYLIEYFDANFDLTDSQYYAEFVMIRNFSVANNIIYDNDIYIIERKYFNEYSKELLNENKITGNSIAFPITNIKKNSYSNSYTKFNDNFNIHTDESNINAQFCQYDKDNNVEIGFNVYQLFGIENNTLDLHKKIKCDKIKFYHPLNKKRLNAIIDITNYVNGINFHYLCRPLNQYQSNTETEIKYDNETYSEYIELFFPNLDDLFKINSDGSYNIYYKEDFNIVASTKNKEFINSIMSDSEDLEHSQYIGNSQIVALNLLIQPFRIIEEYDSTLDVNFNSNVADDQKHFVKLYLKNNLMNNNNYIYNNINIIIYPYTDIDNDNNMYLFDSSLSIGYMSTYSESRFKLMSRLGFNDGIISIVSLFDYPRKSYFYSLYKDAENTSPIKEAYQYYNNVNSEYYKIFVSEDLKNEFDAIDKIESINDEMIQTVKEVANTNCQDKSVLLDIYKRIMKETIIKEYEEEHGVSPQFLGFKIQITSDMMFKNIIYEKNVPINFDDLDDFAFQINNIFDNWNQKPEKIIAKVTFYDMLIGFELSSNLIIITKEWFKYLINDTNIYRLNELSNINKKHVNIDMNVVSLDKNDNINIEKINNLKESLDNFFNDIQDKLDENDIIPNYTEMINDIENSLNLDKVNFINNIKCIVNKEKNEAVNINSSINQKIIIKPIFYKVKDLQSITLRPNINNKIGINLSECLTKVNTFKLKIDNKEFIEFGRNNIFVIFNINASELSETEGTYDITDDEGNYISSGKWSINQ